MKKTSTLIRIGFVLAFCCTLTALMELLGAHPQISIGRFHCIWLGVRRMEFASGTMTTSISGQEKVVQRDFGIGPLKVAIDYP